MPYKSKEKRAANFKKWYAKNRDRQIAKMREYTRAHAKENAANCKLRRETLRKRDPDLYRLMQIWRGMMMRGGAYKCSNPRTVRDYSGRGIRICKEWLDFEKFYNWSMDNGYGSKLQIDRINNDSGYEPENCRWVTPSENSRNRRCSPRVNGVLLNDLYKAGHAKGLTYRLLYKRIYSLGWSVEKSLKTPPQKYSGRSMVA